MRTGKVKLFSTHFFCVLKTYNFLVHYKYLIINKLSIVGLKICFTFASSKGQEFIEKLNRKFVSR